MALHKFIEKGVVPCCYFPLSSNNGRFYHECSSPLPVFEDSENNKILIYHMINSGKMWPLISMEKDRGKICFCPIKFEQDEEGSLIISEEDFNEILKLKKLPSILM